jgi:hypothetical protein
MTATSTFTLIRNVYKTFTLVIPNTFVEDTSIHARSYDTTTGTANPSLGYSCSASDILDTSYGIATPAGSTAGGTTHTYNALVSNCQILRTITSSYSSTSTSLGIGSSGSNSYRTWIPFTVNEAGPVISATITFYAATSSALATPRIRIGCELKGNPVAPTGISLPDYYNDLNSRIMTTHFTSDYAVPAWTAGTAYTYDITTAVSEVLALSTWATGQIIAVLIKDYGSTIGVNRQIASYQNGTYTAPVLTVTI